MSDVEWRVFVGSRPDEINAVVEDLRSAAGLPLRAGCNPVAVLETLNDAFALAIRERRQTYTAPAGDVRKMACEVAKKAKALALALGFDPNDWAPVDDTPPPPMPSQIRHLGERVGDTVLTAPNTFLHRIEMSAVPAPHLPPVDDNDYRTKIGRYALKLLPDILSLLCAVAEQAATPPPVSGSGGDRKEPWRATLYDGLHDAWGQMFDRSANTSQSKSQDIDPRGAWLKRVFDIAERRASAINKTLDTATPEDFAALPSGPVWAVKAAAAIEAHREDAGPASPAGDIADAVKALATGGDEWRATSLARAATRRNARS